MAVSRRTQSERRAATRGALLDAAIVSLVEDGYANTTTRKIADRAGVSQGTQQHYFATKHELVVEAMRYAAEQLTADVAQRIDLRDFLNAEKQEAMLDEIWRIHQTPAFKASLELWIAARTDDELRRSMRAMERDISRIVGGTAQELVPAEHADPALFELLDAGLATIRGFAMLAPVIPQDDLDRRWRAARGHLAGGLRAWLAHQARV
ncbi:MAG: TetR family transcriptional regulator [Solirubrobacteraceae bacterium]|nr:TetR family transcriptional regulator [Solirubrobacteraceae bacterium]